MIQVREYALLTTDSSCTPSMDLGVISKDTFEWLMGVQKTWKDKVPLFKIEGHHCIKLESYVGYLQSPKGESIEILPKIESKSPTDTELLKIRQQLRDMLLVSMKIKPREASAATVQTHKMPLHEWILTQFLSELVRLVRYGLRFDYQSIEEESRYIRGQLNQTRQSRQTPDRATWFHIKHDIFTPNRIENRLLKTALNYVLKLTKNPDNWRIANELSHQLSEIEPLLFPVKDLGKWRNSKLMQRYETIKPWCEIIIHKLNPQFQKGNANGISLLFPMERLFENYVAHWLQKSKQSEASLKKQSASQHLLRHAPISDTEKWFELRPDLLLTMSDCSYVMDTKWKLLDDSQIDVKYKLSQQDMYQMFAYGHFYMAGKGDLMLIYPAHSQFLKPLPKFSYNNELHIWVVPFDLKDRQLVRGDWCNSFPVLSAPVMDYSP